MCNDLCGDDDMSEIRESTQQGSFYHRKAQFRKVQLYFIFASERLKAFHKSHSKMLFQCKFLHV